MPSAVLCRKDGTLNRFLRGFLPKLNLLRTRYRSCKQPLPDSNLDGLKTDEAAERILDLFVKTKNNQELVRTVVKNHYI